MVGSKFFIVSPLCTHIVILDWEDDKSMRIFLQERFFFQQALFLHNLVFGLAQKHGRAVGAIIGTLR